MPPKRTDFDVGDLIERYRSGISENEIAKTFGISRSTVRRTLLHNKIRPRGIAEAAPLRSLRLTPEQKRKMTKAAHEASRGRRVPDEELFRKALAKQGKEYADENTLKLGRLLKACGVDPIYQPAIGPYNPDLLLGTLVVELFGGKWHWYGRHLARTPKRIRYLLDRGYDVLMVSVDKGRVTATTCDYVIAHAKILDAHPSHAREYRVIDCAGETLAAGRAYDEEISIIPAFTNRRNETTGRYERVAR